MLPIQTRSTQLLRKLARKSPCLSATAPKSTVAAGTTGTGSNQYEDAITNQSSAEKRYSNTLSFASPESDFSTSHILMKSQYTDFDYAVDANAEVDKDWSGALSYSSPESDFTLSHQQASSNDATSSPENSWSGALSYTSPESDFTCSSEHFVQQIKENKETKEAKAAFFEHSSQVSDDTAYSLSYATAESDFTNPAFTSMLNDRMKKQLEIAALQGDREEANLLSRLNKPKEMQTQTQDLAKDDALEYQELRAHADIIHHEDLLPLTLEEATADPEDQRAIVVTEAQIPFRIVSVNPAWEKLCGFSAAECNGKTLNCIQGPETNQAALTALMSQLLRGEQAGTILTNYRKDGSKFHNRLRVGGLKGVDGNNRDAKVTHFVGVLKEVAEMEDQFVDEAATRIHAF
jgi:PAS domain S-box-containing protein